MLKGIDINIRVVALGNEITQSDELHYFTNLGKTYKIQINYREVMYRKELPIDENTDIALVFLDSMYLGAKHFLPRVKLKFPNLKIISVVHHSDLNAAQYAVNENLHGIINSSYSNKLLKESIFNVYQGGNYYCDKWRDIINKNILNNEYLANSISSMEAPNFSRREREVLTHLSKNLSVNNIANKLNIDPKTVYKHKYNIMDKLKITSSNALIAVANKFQN